MCDVIDDKAALDSLVIADVNAVNKCLKIITITTQYRLCLSVKTEQITAAHYTDSATSLLKFPKFLTEQYFGIYLPLHDVVGQGL